MKKCGIICEYNPFHNGHHYHIVKTKQLLDADIVCVMSGDFTQRADAAIFDKSIRAKMALKSGADAVIQLPVLYSTAPAEVFAYGAVKVLSNIKGLKFLSFGVETEHTNLLETIADVQLIESKTLKNQIKKMLGLGLSYPNCLAMATAKEIGQEDLVLDVLSRPNNVLAIEYLKSIKRQGLDITPVYVPRTDSGYNSKTLTAPYASATAIRELIQSGKDYLQFVPDKYPLSTLDNSFLHKTMLLSLIQNEIQDTEGLGIKLKKAAGQSADLQELLANVKSKRYTYSRIKRLILATMLQIDNNLYNYKGDVFYTVLGVKKSFKEKLKDLGSFAVIRQSDMPYINQTAQEIYLLDKLASDIYAVASGQNALRFYHKLLEV